MPRRLLSKEERALRDGLKLDKWVKNTIRRRAYFETIDLILETLGKETFGGGEPRDAAVVAMLAVAIGEDESVTDHVLRRNAAAPDWEEISRTCAGGLYEQYLRAREDGKWPEQ